MNVNSFGVAIFMFSGANCADGRHTSVGVLISFFVVRIRFRTTNEHIAPFPDPSVIGSYVDRSCHAPFLIMQNTVDRPAIDHLQFGEIVGVQQRIAKDMLNSKRSGIVSPISARNDINAEWLLFKKLGSSE